MKNRMWLRMLFCDEVKNMDELLEKLDTLDTEFGKIKVCVLCFLYDQNGNLILNRRGPGARDEVGKIQALGGSVNNSDGDFRAALLRELKEEGGSNATYQITDFIGALKNTVVDSYSKESIDWILLAYKGYVVSGEVENNEPDRCSGIEKMPASEYNEEEISKSTLCFMKKMLSEE